MTPTIAIIGGNGYIGSSLANFLKKKNLVRLIDLNFSSKKQDKNIDFQICDIRDYQKLNKVLAGCQLIIHTAIIQIPLINEQKKLAYEVNILGTQNVCRIAEESRTIKGLLLTGTWHTIGEREIKGTINEEFGFRPDKVEDRARLYAISKMGQEAVVRFYDEMSKKVFGIIRMGTVLGVGMPEKTAANIFINQSLTGKALSPYKHSMYRPMLYVDIDDICRSFELFIKKILRSKKTVQVNSLDHIVNVYYPKATTIIKLAEIIRDTVAKYSKRSIIPKIQVIDEKKPMLFSKNDQNKLKADITKSKQFLGLKRLTSPDESVKKLILHHFK